MASVVLGYTCVCGERVTVFHLEQGTANQLPQIAIVSCPNGHTATFTSQQIGLLDLWTRDPSGNQPALDQDDSLTAA